MTFVLFKNSTGGSDAGKIKTSLVYIFNELFKVAPLDFSVPKNVTLKFY